MSAANEYRNDAPHSLRLEDRSRLSVSGVSEVVSFDEEEIIMETACGRLTVDGTGLHVEKLSLDVEELTVTGEIESLCYAQEHARRGGFWSRVF